MQITPLYGYNSNEVRQIVDKVNLRLSLRISNATIRAAMTDVSSLVVTPLAITGFRKIIGEERDKIAQVLCDRVAKKFDYEPKPRDLQTAVEAAGYTCSREFLVALMKMLKQQYAQRWALASKTSRRLYLLDGEVAMWDALRHTYNMNSDAVASMLLRIFAMSATTGRLDPLEVSYLAASMSDKDLSKYAASLNFTVNKTRRSRL